MIRSVGVYAWVVRSLVFASAIVGCAASASPDGAIALTPMRWDLHGDGDFAVDAALGSEIRLRRGTAILKDMNFSDGTIEFDIGLKEGGVVGLTFRQQDPSNAEVFYFRPQPDCDRSSDCIQYMPLSHGAFEWDLYPQFETAAPIRASAWNHVRLVISGRRMNAYVNGATLPSLSVGRLAGDQDAGTIAFHGPADIANVKVEPGRTDGLPREPVHAAQDADPNVLRNWLVTPASLLPTNEDAGLKVRVGRPPKYAETPIAESAWRRIRAEPDGLVNLSREVGSSVIKTNVSVVWLRANVRSSRDQMKTASLGWAREAWVFVNGKLVFADRNFYGIPGASKEPDGRVSLRNGEVRLPLRKGSNEIVVALDDNFGGNAQHFGWGMRMRWNDLRGIS